jgi:hypothetical protein
MNFLRLGVLYVHLISCCVAVGVILVSDIRFVRSLFVGSRVGDGEELETLEKIVTPALVALWLTGSGLVSIDVVSSGLRTLGNPKLQAKIAIVVLLTLNGWLLHALVLPAVKKAGSLVDLAPSSRLFAVFSGAVSGVSWGYAAMLGIARPWSWKYSLAELLAAYPVLIVAAFALLALITAWSKHLHSAERPNASAASGPVHRLAHPDAVR